MLKLQPGPAHLLGFLPNFIVPSATVYLSLRVLQEQLHLDIPSSLVIASTVLARPFLFILTRYYTLWANNRAAIANGAVLAPEVQQSTLSIISALTNSVKNGYPGDVVLDWLHRYGSVVRFDLFNNGVFVTHEPDHVKAILATQFDSFDKGPLFIGQMDSLLGTGIFNADGEIFHRAMTRPFFTRERISDFEIYDRNADLSLQEARKRLSEGYSFDFQDLVSRFTLDSATEFLFGSSVHSISAGIPYPKHAEHKTPQSFHDHPSNVFVKAFSQGQVLSALRTGMGADWPFAEFWKDEVIPLRKAMDAFTGPVMEAALEKREKELSGQIETKEGEETTLLAHLVKNTQDPKILKDQLINLLVAGRDTTMCLLSFSFYMLAQHPEIEHRLRQEIFEKVGATDSPTYEQMREMKYTRAFLNEVLRLYPPVPVDSRTTNKAVVLPSKNGQPPIYLPANTNCIYAVMNIHRRTDLWGPDALKFDPDRFLDERVHKYLTPNPFIFCPFNAGPRICLGQQFAYHEATFYLVRLLQQFTGFSLDLETIVPPPAEWASEYKGTRKSTEQIHPLSHLTMYIKGGLWVRMKELQPGAVDS
ncbi:hypothetical protein M413DRAFT_444410 [Hebeloma cylindrosporum]|uniref:Cytochrome P450 n=1 Tax=Hebeloma cylindrosporum TaxID=76867 RepID=A0A0C2XYP6_HEBCY|nr:hypothetical protein M413DRAFT_444410 [Hebeloma cylindrosporum h7]